MKKRKLKPFVIPSICGIIVSSIVLTLLIINKDTKITDDNYTYVNSSIISKSLPTISETEEEVVSKPFSSEKVEVYKKYYDSNASEEDRNNSIIFYNNTYVQNTGILYKSNEKFDVTSILDGTIIEIKKDDTLGNVVIVKHKNNITSTYQGLSEITVKKDQNIKQGDLIGISGKINVEENLDNSLLIETTKDGKLINPESLYNKKINEL